MKIKAFLRTILMDPSISNLTGGKTVHFVHPSSPVAPYVECAIYDEDGALYAEGKEIATNYYIQVDIYSKGDYTALEDAIMAKMKGSGFERSGGADLYESDTFLYHKAMRFIYTTNTI